MVWERPVSWEVVFPRLDFFCRRKVTQKTYVLPTEQFRRRRGRRQVQRPGSHEDDDV